MPPDEIEILTGFWRGEILSFLFCLEKFKTF
jgi:hypothetical protein